MVYIVHIHSSYFLLQKFSINSIILYFYNNTKIQLKDGQKFTLVNEDITGDEEKVSVTPAGVITGLQEGTVNVTVSYEGLQDIITVTVGA